MVEEMAVIVKKSFDVVDHKFEAIAERFEQQNKELREYMDDKAEEMREHFDAVAENIHRDVAGASRGEIDLLQNKQEDHEGRITRLEEKTGVR